MKNIIFITLPLKIKPKKTNLVKKSNNKAFPPQALSCIFLHSLIT